MKGKKIGDPLMYLKKKKQESVEAKKKDEIQHQGSSIKRKEIRDTINEPFPFVKQERKTAYEQDKESQCKAFLLTAC